MKRQIGCCSWIFGDCPLAEVATRTAAAGLAGVELFGDWQNVDPEQASSILGDHGLQVFSLTPADADISHPEPSVRDAALEYYKGLVDFAAALGNPLISCHGQVTRTKPIATQAQEDEFLLQTTRQVCEMAASRNLTVVFEILNRYESHQINTVEDGLSLLQAVHAENLLLLPDAYHMNIEEADPAAALQLASGRIGLYHAADSNRCGIGQGNTDFAPQFRALDTIDYSGPVILEVNAPGPNPFTADKDDGD